MVKEDGSDVVQMTGQGEKAPLLVVVPQLDPVVVPS